MMQSFEPSKNMEKKSMHWWQRRCLRSTSTNLKAVILWGSFGTSKKTGRWLWRELSSLSWDSGEQTGGSDKLSGTRWSWLTSWSARHAFEN